MREEIYGRQKSRELWLKEGDRNTKFFHASTKIRKASSSILAINSASTEDLMVSQQDICNQGAKFFKNLLAPIKCLRDNMVDRSLLL